MNVPEMVTRAARLYADRVAVECDGRQLSYGAVNERANRLANALIGLGLPQGARVAMLMFNALEYAEVDFGIGKAGMVNVQINPRLQPAEVLTIVQDAGAGALIMEASFLPAIESIRAQLDPRLALICVGGRESWTRNYETLIGSASPREPLVALSETAMYRLGYTSGTTGHPKGVIMSHRAILAVAYQLLLEFGPVRPGHRFLHLQPLTHGTGMFVLPWFLRGGVSVIHPRFDPERVVASRAKENIQTIKLVPTMLVRMLEQGETSFQQLRGIQSIIYGGSPMPVEKLREAITLLGPVFAQLYGQTEAPMTITILPPEDHVLGDPQSEKRLASAGRPWTAVDVRVVDDAGTPLPPGAVGEVIVSGAHIMDGYWNNPDETGRMLVDGWVRTRDIGTFDEGGYLFLLDRKGDMIITGGFNVYPREVEDVLHEHPAVLEAMVVALPDPTWGEAVTAAVVTRKGHTAEPAELLAFCRERLSYYKRPKEVVLLPELPKNGYGKIVRRDVKRLLLEARTVEGGSR